MLKKEKKNVIPFIGILLVLLVLVLYKFVFKEKPETTSLSLPGTQQDQIMYDITRQGITCDSPDNTQNDRCTVDMIAGNFAKGKMSGGYWMAVKKDSGWKVAVTGNGFPGCMEIDKYSIPKEIYVNCLEASGELRF